MKGKGKRMVHQCPKCNAELDQGDVYFYGNTKKMCFQCHKCKAVFSIASAEKVKP